MTLCIGKALRSTRSAEPRKSAAHAPRLAATGAPSCSISAVALAVALLAAAAGPARAASECGPDANGNDTVTCSAASYASGITYATSNGLTLNLANPDMVISGAQGVSLQSGLGPVNPELIVNASSIGSITSAGAAVTISNSSTGGFASVNIASGTLTSTGATGTVSASAGASSAQGAQVTLTGGQVLNTGTGGGILASTSGVTGTGAATVVITGGTVQTSNSAVSAIISGTNHTGTSSIRMSGGSVLSTDGNGLWARTTGVGLGQVEMSGGTVAASGADADGILASSRAGTYAVDITGGTVSGGGGLGAAIHGFAPAGIVTIGASAVVDAGASGVAIRDGDANKDGIDENNGNAAITTAGTINGSVVLGGGTDTLTVKGGAINGDITGDGADTLHLDLGANRLAYGAAYAISGMDAVVMDSGTARVDGSIAGNTLSIKGGTLVLGGNAAFTGMTSVEGGTLAVNGTLNGNVNVLAPGRLQGSGTVGSTTVAGTVAPGNSIGTLGVNGNFAQSSGSTYEVEVDPASTASDLIRVSGNASIASGSQLQAMRTSGANFGIGNRYTVLSADGGVTGTYQLTGDTESAFARLVDSYDANHVYLTAEKTRSIADAGSTGNQAAVGGAIDSLPADNGLATAVTWLPNDFAARDALNQLSADIHASTKTATLEDSRFVREAAIDRLRSAACAPGSMTRTPQEPGCTPENKPAVTGWAHAFGSWGHIDSDGNASKLKRDIGGIVVGADTSVGAGWRVGAMGGYSHASADTSARNSSSKTDSYHLGAYGGTQWGATSLRLGLSQSWNKLDTSRFVAFQGFDGSLSGDYDSTTTQAFADIGHRIDLGRAALEPFAGLAHVRLRSDAFYEQGGPAALYSYGGSTDATFSSLGVRASTQAGDNLRLRGMLAWRHAFGDTTPSTTHAFGGSLPFTLSGVPLAKNVAAVEAGVETQLRKNLTLSASYSGQFGDGLQDHGAKVELNWAF